MAVRTGHLEALTLLAPRRQSVGLSTRAAADALSESSRGIDPLAADVALRGTSCTNLADGRQP